MKTTVYDTLPEDAIRIRKDVFMTEQGFIDEFDDMEESSIHIVMYEDDLPIATCRIFKEIFGNAYRLGRIAVVKSWRGQHIGARLISEAEKYIESIGGDTVIIHAQCRAKGFYNKVGYNEYGEIDAEENVPHIWMKKQLFVCNAQICSLNSH